MSIKHLKPKSRKEIIASKKAEEERIASLPLSERIDEFIEDMSENLPSAMEIYLPEKKRAKLYDLVKNKKYKIKAKGWDQDFFYDEMYKESKKLYNKIVQPWIDKGWEVFHFEDNMSSGEVIFVKPPEIKEFADSSLGGVKSPYTTIYNTPGVGNPRPGGIINEEAMGGVSSPVATLNNTPGMGNVIPGSVTTGSRGSGDKFSNVINKKPYTQVANPKRKKKVMLKKKKVELSENNINPYDKIGTAMAKKMRIKPPLKKKKEKGNQNAIVSRKFEHEIISFDEFKKLLD
jgi:hypothetical protein